MVGGKSAVGVQSITKVEAAVAQLIGSFDDPDRLDALPVTQLVDATTAVG